MCNCWSGFKVFEAIDGTVCFIMWPSNQSCPTLLFTDHTRSVDVVHLMGHQSLANSTIKHVIEWSATGHHWNMHSFHLIQQPCYIKTTTAMLECTCSNTTCTRSPPFIYLWMDVIFPSVASQQALRVYSLRLLALIVQKEEVLIQCKKRTSHDSNFFVGSTFTMANQGCIYNHFL